jgi:hypothetical protein
MLLVHGQNDTHFPTVIPAQAGIQKRRLEISFIPPFAAKLKGLSIK